jgi:hypothetical protein
MTYNDEVTTYRVGLVACSAGKLDHAAPARDLYTSQLFRKAAAYADATCDRWYILSAKHGLLAPEDVVEPYDERLPRNPRSADVRRWAIGVRAALDYVLADVPGATLVVLAGEAYRVPLAGAPWPLEVPMAGLGIGQQLGYLTRQLAGA